MTYVPFKRSQGVWVPERARYYETMFFSRIFAAFLALVLCSGAGLLHAQPQQLDLSAMPSAYLGAHAELLFEEGPALTLSQVQGYLEAGKGVPSAHQVPGYSIGARSVWLHWQVHNPAASPVAMQLAVGPTWLDFVDAYVVHAQQVQTHWQTGDERAQPPGLRAALGYQLPVLFAPGRSDLYVRVQSVDPMVIPVELLTPEQAAHNDVLIRYSYGFIYGFLIALVVYNVMLYFGLRARSHLFYSIYLTSLICLDIAYTGHGLAYVWPQQLGVQRYVILGWMVVFGCAGLMFAQRFLDLPTHARRANVWVQRGIVAVMLAFAACVALQSHLAAAWLAFGFFGVFTLGMVFLGALTLRQGRVAGRYFLMAVVCGMVGALLTFLTVLGFAPYTTLSYHALEIGVMLEATLLALAVAYQMRRQHKDTLLAQHAASHDPLTGLFNRRAFMERAQGLWSSAGRGLRPLSLIMLDLDNFKTINDVHGHAMGDQALVHSAQVLAAACRAGDVLARWGGEEFILLLPETDIEQATAFAERLRQQFEQQVLHAGKQVVPLTASFGVVQRGGHPSLDGLIKSADVALYQAKHGGRNQVSRFADLE